MRQVRLADKKAGRTLIDDLDLHWYPEATGGGVRVTGTDTTPAVVAAREQAPRSLWDKSYVEDSWITQDTLDDKGIDLIPRLDGMIAAYDPGMNLDLSEWNYGGGQAISGAIATADVLGIFGRYGVHASAVWPLNSNESYTFGAFAMYRNYNGHGAAFGDTEVSATTTDKVEHLGLRLDRQGRPEPCCHRRDQQEPQPVTGHHRPRRRGELQERSCVHAHERLFDPPGGGTPHDFAERRLPIHDACSVGLRDRADDPQVVIDVNVIEAPMPLMR